AGIRVEDQAQFHVREYLHALADAVDGDGCHVFEETRVTAIEDGSPCQVTTELGTLHAADVIEATTTPLNRVFLHTKLYPYRTYAVAARLKGPLEPGLYWDTAQPYHYTRTQRLDAGNWVIVGG